MDMKKMPFLGAYVGLCLNFLFFNASAFSNFTNYQSVIRVNDVIASHNVVWVASSGGLFCCDFTSGVQTHYSDGYCFPDLNLTALAQDAKGNLWIGTKRGYLYKRSPGGDCSVYNSYFGSKWEITTLKIYKDYVLVGSRQGCSLFDPAKSVAIRNATATDTSGDPAVYALAIHNDSLYVGGNKGYSAVDISGNRILNIDKAKWTSVVNGKPIVAFIDSSDKLIASETPAAMVGSVLYRSVGISDSSIIIAGVDTVDTVPDKITKMSVEDGQTLWFGTEQNYLYHGSGSMFSQIRLGGLTFNTVFRIHAARNGTVWLLSGVNDLAWWEGISAFDGKDWRIYNRFHEPSIGTFTGGGSILNGICEDREGNIWVGTPGSFVKNFNIKTKLWSVYYVTGRVPGAVEFDSIAQVPSYFASWGVHDAIAQDSSGYMWFSNYDPRGAIATGPLVCYDASGRHSPNCRRFFPINDPHYAQNLTSISVDSKGIILTGTNDGRLLVVRHNGDPIAGGVKLVREESGIDISNICAGADGISWIATGKGLYRYKSDKDSLVSISDIQTSINSITAENDHVLWLGTPSDGLIRYDLSKGEKNVIDMSKGLVSNSVKDLSIDHKAGYLWIASTEGVSRYYLGHSDTPVSGNASSIALPNPFSQSNPRHRMIIFKHCAPDAQLLIYAMNGALVAKLSRESNSFNSIDDNPFESTLCWIPPKKLSPGVYYFVGTAKKPVTTKKLFIVP
jgi:ligand-binding sensor domain-containing protein